MFKFNWNFFNVDDLQRRCSEAFTESIANTKLPPSIAEPIRATKVEFGDTPPQIVFKEIKQVGLKRSHLTFEVKYSGNASTTLKTAVHANPLADVFSDPLFPCFLKPQTVFALRQLVLPFALVIKNVVLDTKIDLVYTEEGVIAVFGPEPVKSLEITTSLDEIPMLNAVITEILKQNVLMSFEEDIPESIWASTSPLKRPPDPFYGARRWSRHKQRFTKFTNFFSLNPRRGLNTRKCTQACTLSLNVECPPALRPPWGIASRACLPQAVDSEAVLETVADLVETTSFVPKKRVICLREPRKNAKHEDINIEGPSSDGEDLSYNAYDASAYVTASSSLNASRRPSMSKSANFYRAGNLPKHTFSTPLSSPVMTPPLRASTPTPPTPEPFTTQPVLSQHRSYSTSACRLARCASTNDLAPH